MSKKITNTAIKELIAEQAVVNKLERGIWDQLVQLNEDAKSIVEEGMGIQGGESAFSNPNGFGKQSGLSYLADLAARYGIEDEIAKPKTPEQLQEEVKMLKAELAEFKK